jgi:cell division protein FtsX
VLRKMRRDLKALIKRTQSTLKALGEFDPAASPGAGAAADPSAELLHEALLERIKTESDFISRELMQLRMLPSAQKDTDRIDALAEERMRLRRLVWRTAFKDLPPDEARVLESLIPAAVKDQKAVLKDARRKLKEVESANRFRRSAKIYDLSASVSLHLSSHGDGFGAFNYGFMFPFRPRINRVASYAKLDEVLRTAAEQVGQETGHAGFFKDTLRPSSRRSWQSYFLDRPSLGGEVVALAGRHGLTFATTHDARARWGTPFDTPERVNLEFALKQKDVICGMIEKLSAADRLHDNLFPRNGISELNGRAKFLRHGELFADKPAPGTVLLCYQGPARFYVMVDHMGDFHLRGISDKKHTYHKVIIEGYKFNPQGEVVWTIDKNQTGKNAYRVKMMRRFMETDLVMFACEGATIFNVLEPRSFRYMTKPNIIDGRREAEPLRWFMSRLDTWSSSITSVYLDPGTPLKMTLSDTYLRRKMLLLNATAKTPSGKGYLIDEWPFLHRTEFLTARDMWTLLTPRIQNLEKRGIFNERIRKLQAAGLTALNDAEQAWAEKRYGPFVELSKRSWALASRVYYDIDETQKDVLYGVLFYIALFVPFAFCLERLLFAYANIYKRIVAFIAILLLLIAVIYNVHPAFRLAYSPTVVILAFFIMGLSVMVTLIIFFRFENEVANLQTRAQVVQSGEIGRWKAFVAAFLLGVTNLRRRRLRTALTCATLVILTFTIMSFTSVKSMRRHARLMYDTTSPYQGFLLKNVNWTDLPAEAYAVIANSFAGKTLVVPRVWLEDEDRTRTTRIPVQLADKTVEARGLVGLSAAESEVSQLDRILVGGRWLSPQDRFAVLLPERLAENLGIDPSRPGGRRVQLWGMPFEVVGVFSPARLQELTDLDGETMTPVTFPHEASAVIPGEEEEALESGEEVREFQSRYQHVSADLTLMMPYRTLLAAGGHLKSVAVKIQDDTSAQAVAQDLVDRFGLSLFSGESDGTFLYNASDSMSYSGVPNIIIPLVIAVFIVLNTMIGSVYERKREIGIYTSVGLAPSHVSFLFIAEAMAFAVLSVVTGYLLAQTTARLFAETSLWAGITVNYSSLAGVGAMVLVIAVVLVSVLYPSKVAGEIAIPDINRSWTLPEPRGNQLSLTLPFLMTYKEHRSVGGFLYDYFSSHQDVSHGMFSTADVSFRFICETPPAYDATVDCPEGDCEYDQCLHISSRVWLAPFDFGIMQGVDMRFKPSPDEKGFLELKVDLKRESGEANAWHRINKTFLHHLRKQLLIWRSFDDQAKRIYEKLLTDAEIEVGLRQVPDQ